MHKPKAESGTKSSLRSQVVARSWRENPVKDARLMQEVHPGEIYWENQKDVFNELFHFGFRCKTERIVGRKCLPHRLREARLLTTLLSICVSDVT